MYGIWWGSGKISDDNKVGIGDISEPYHLSVDVCMYFMYVCLYGLFVCLYSLFTFLLISADSTLT